ncbi:MAG: tyrosine-type recombinase/integrase [Nitrososphaeraceae archaeon]
MQRSLSTEKQITDYKAVNIFLSSISRNSLSSKYSYQSGLAHFQKFLKQKYPRYDIQTVPKSLSNKELDMYTLLDEFVSYLMKEVPNLTSNSIKLYMAAMRSYLAYYDIDVIPSKFKRKVKMPKQYREDEEPLDVSDIRKILLSCNNRRLKTYLIILASSGLRATEGCALRLHEVDFSVNPTKIHVRKEYSKTKVSRDVYISDEATHYLKQWIDWKYRDKGEWTKEKEEDELIFSVYRISNEANPYHLYGKMALEFEKLLATIGMDDRKEDGLKIRRKITLHSFRRFVKTVISDQAGQDYSEWFLGHSKSPYYTKKEPQRREIYTTKCMKYLTLLDYTTLEATGKNIEAKLSEKEKEIQLLRQRDSMNSDAIAGLSDKMQDLMIKIQELEKKQQT